MSGSGKSNTGFIILSNLQKQKKPFLVFDWKRGYRDLLSLPEGQEILVFTIGRDITPFHFNPLIPPKGTQPSVWLNKLIEVMGHAYFLGHGVAHLLQKAFDTVWRNAHIEKTYPTFSDVKTWLEKYKTKGRETLWMDSTRRAVGALCFEDMGRVLNIRKPPPLEQLLQKPVILELDALTNANKTFFIEALLLWIHPLISLPALATYTTIATNLKTWADVKAISDAMLLEPKDRVFLGRLPVGTAFLWL